ncbi:hypothetical protein AcV7_000203 [Taiwanofungus camphoratus]|nr:hypothetical protein AcV7_000203 [Antrodia cinnamomea]
MQQIQHIYMGVKSLLKLYSNLDLLTCLYGSNLGAETERIVRQRLEWRQNHCRCKLGYLINRYWGPMSPREACRSKRTKSGYGGQIPNLKNYAGGTTLSRSRYQ